MLLSVKCTIYVRLMYSCVLLPDTEMLDFVFQYVILSSSIDTILSAVLYTSI